VKNKRLQLFNSCVFLSMEEEGRGDPLMWNAHDLLERKKKTPQAK
jgi:hypothetical protein